MARLSLEPSLFRDDRFIQLILASKSKTFALGIIVEALLIASEYYLDPETCGLIPNSKWEMNPSFKLLIECGLATREDSGIRLWDLENQFKRKTQCSKAGKRSWAGIRRGTLKSAPQSQKTDNESITYDNVRSTYVNESITYVNVPYPNPTEQEPKSKQIVNKPKHHAPSPSMRPVKFDSYQELFSSFDKETIAAWAALYPDQTFLHRQALKAWEWYRANPIKMPKTIKGWKRAMNHWFESDWPKHLKGINSNKAVGLDIDWDNFFKKVHSKKESEG